MATSREKILSKLRAAQSSLPEFPPVDRHLPMVPTPDSSPDALVKRFTMQAQKLGSTVHDAASDAQAVEALLSLLNNDSSVLSWSFSHIPLAGLEEALQSRHIVVAEARDPSVRVGITGADAALAATGSLVLATGQGRHRVTSLLPPVHIAVVRQEQVVADFETWVAMQRAQGVDAFRNPASTMIISGPSRTADIAMQLIMGMHGPAEHHIILVGDES
jgi:L-lactate dehydrogenase complex protein LldG